MTRSRVLPLLVAGLAIAALGVTATSLETTLTTDPDEEINPDWERLPLGEDAAADIKEQIGNGGDPTEDDSEAGSASEEAEESDDTSAGSDASEAGDAESSESNAGDGAVSQSKSTERATAQSSGGGDDRSLGQDSGTRTVAADPTLLDRLAALLQRVLRTLLPVLALLALGAVCYRYRERLRSLLGLGPAEGRTTAGDSDPEGWPGTTPSNVVDRAWVRMVERVDPDRPETTTPAECRALARQRSLDGEAVEAVEAIATAFERVHYGGAALADERDRAREGLRRLDGVEE